MTKTRRFSIIFSCPLKSSNANGRRAFSNSRSVSEIFCSLMSNRLFSTGSCVHRISTTNLTIYFAITRSRLVFFKAMHESRALNIPIYFREWELSRRRFNVSFRSILTQNSLCARKASSMEVTSSHPRKRAYTPTTYRTTDSSRQNRLKLAKHIFGVIGINRIRFRSIIENTIPSSCLSNKIFPAE